MDSRIDHLNWCKKRAHEYLSQGDVSSAIASMLSDLNKHPETTLKSPTLQILGMHAAINQDVEAAKRFIDGFN